MNIKRTALLAMIGVVMAGAAVSGASADTFHPRRAEVNGRLMNQDVRIHEARRDGDITPRRARYLHRADFRVRLQERRFAYFHHGHISRAEQRHLNREENRISRHIPA